jgi:hypothetical protein
MIAGVSEIAFPGFFSFPAEGYLPRVSNILVHLLNFLISRIVKQDFPKFVEVRTNLLHAILNRTDHHVLIEAISGLEHLGNFNHGVVKVVIYALVQHISSNESQRCNCLFTAAYCKTKAQSYQLSLNTNIQFLPIRTAYLMRV